MKRAERGFTLLEVMLAFVLLASATGLLIAMLSTGLRQVQQAQRETEATLYAQSLLDSLGVLGPITPDQRSGEFDDGRYKYQLDIEETDDPAPRAEAADMIVNEPLASAPKLYRIALVVSWGNGQAGQQMHFTTLRARVAEDAAKGMP